MSEENGATTGPSSPSFTLNIQIPTDTIPALMEELDALHKHAEPGSRGGAFLESILRSLRAAEVITHPDRVPLRDRLKFAAEYARTYAARTQSAGHPAAATLDRITRTLDEMLQQSDEELQRRMPEVENLIRRLSEFATTA